jgi:hypothetical protein
VPMFTSLLGACWSGPNVTRQRRDHPHLVKGFTHVTLARRSIP